MPAVLFVTFTFGGGVLFLLADGSVRAITAGVNVDTWAGALTPAGGEVLANDW